MSSVTNVAVNIHGSALDATCDVHLVAQRA